MKRPCFSALLLLLSTTAAYAIDPGPSSPQQQETERWMQLQLSGQVASQKVQTLSPLEREQSLQRWLDSYKHTIPEFYKQDEGGKLQGGGSN